MEKRLPVVARLLDGEAMSDVCRSFGIFRKTGHKIFNRCKQEGLGALCDRSRRPVRYANQSPDQAERLTVACKRDKPHWGARTIRERMCPGRTMLQLAKGNSPGSNGLCEVDPLDRTESRLS